MNSILKPALALFIAFSFSATTLAHAEGSTETNANQSAMPDSENPSSLTEGEVKKVDKDAGKLTIKHGELKNLSMPAMTMVFRAKKPAIVDQVKPGDKVNFVAERIGGQFTVTKIEVK